MSQTVLQHVCIANRGGRAGGAAALELCTDDRNASELRRLVAAVGDEKHLRETDLPELRISATVSALNSLLNWRRILCCGSTCTPYLRVLPSSWVSTGLGQDRT
jgi:hypothetical protein